MKRDDLPAAASDTTGGRTEEGAPPRVVIEEITPQIDGGRFAVKRVRGEELLVRAAVFTEGHDRLAARLLHRPPGEAEWLAVPMRALPNDLWEAAFRVDRLGRHAYTVEAWVDRFATWRHGLEKKVGARQDVASELLEGAEMVRAAARRAAAADAGADARWLDERAELLAGDRSAADRAEAALAEPLREAMDRHPDRRPLSRAPVELEVEVERERARTGAWYELFPRSTAERPGEHGTLASCARRLPYVAAMGFDVVYLPPIHPIGRSHRKGPNNSPTAGEGDPGSPWAIGAAEGGHTAIHPELGTLEDLDALVATASSLGLEIALDLAFQCAPDHPWVSEHPEWFRHRPDGSIQYAENPPKKYQDIYPLEFECDAWRELWEALADVVRFWVHRGIRIFRVDNPHTKPFAFWDWMIREIRRDHPDVIFLSEAFTRPHVMQRLAKGGFSQSYTYFTWRNTKRELEEYLTELTRPPVSDLMRPNLFANTPDILHAYLQTGRRASFQVRAVLAATLAGSYGIYGPVYELCVSDALPDSEDYRDSEKYEVRHWDLDSPWSLAPYLTRINEIRRDNPALTEGGGPRFYEIDNADLIAYGRSTPDGSETVVVVVNLNPYHRHGGWLTLPLEELGLDPERAFQVDDLLGGARYLWSGARNYVELDPESAPAHIFRLRRRVRTERDFDYFG